VARLIRKTDGEAAAGDWVARLRRFHAHNPGPAGSAVELLRELRDQEPCERQRSSPALLKLVSKHIPTGLMKRPT
jgi:hypothetical protein